VFDWVNLRCGRQSVGFGFVLGFVVDGEEGVVVVFEVSEYEGVEQTTEEQTTEEQTTEEQTTEGQTTEAQTTEVEDTR
jgi:hypothetical protein